MHPILTTRRRRRGRRLTAGVAVLVALTLVASACSGSSDSEQSGDTTSISYALPPNATPNWLLPIGLPGYLATHNNAIQAALWVPLVAYIGTDEGIGWDKKASAAEDIQFSDDGLTATVTLKDFSWSDGEPVTSRDVEFWFNLIRYNTDRWGSYAEGRMPDNVKELKVVDDTTFTLTFDRVYNQEWLLANQLTFIQPLPQHAWDRTGADGEIGDHDRTEEGARAVLDYLVSESEKIDTYATNPLWQVVNGPYKVSEFTTSGAVTLAANEAYDGPDTPSITTVELMPFTSADAELNVVRSGGVDYGYIPASSMEQTAQLEDQGYRIDPWEGWSITYIPYNFNNPDMGKVFAQRYMREAIQRSVDQESIARVIWKDAARPGYGPVPQNPPSDFLSEVQKNNPYPFDLEAAKQLLEEHGWTAGDGGTRTCTAPGTGANQCGEGIQQGQKLEMTLLTQSGSAETDSMMAELKSSLQQAGIALNLEKAPLNTVLNRTVPCTPDQPECSWQLSFFGTAGSWYFPAYPTGERIFSTGASANFGNYSNPEADELMQATMTSTDPEAMQKYSALLAEDLPVLWMPNPVYQVSVIAEGLGGTDQDALAEFHPQRWSWTDQ